MPTLDLAPVRSAVKAKVAGVANIGNVYDYERYANKASDLIALYSSTAQSGNRLLGWFVQMARKREFFVDTGRWIADVDWTIRGYMGIEDADATEKKMAVLIDLISDAFRNDDSLGGVIGTQIIEQRGYQVGVQVEEFGPVLFAGVLSHSARLSLVTRIFF